MLLLDFLGKWQSQHVTCGVWYVGPICRQKAKSDLKVSFIEHKAVKGKLQRLQKGKKMEQTKPEMQGCTEQEHR